MSIQMRELRGWRKAIDEDALLKYPSNGPCGELCVLVAITLTVLHGHYPEMYPCC